MGKKGDYVAYVGTYTHENSLGIHVFDVDLEEGKLTKRSEAPVNNASHLNISADGKMLYTIMDESIAAFAIGPEGDLEKVNSEWIGGMRGCYVEVESTGKYLFVAGYHDGRVTMMHLNPDGSIGPIADGIFHQHMGISSVDKRLMPHVTCVRMTPEEKYVCAVDNGLNQVKVYRINREMSKMELAHIIRCPMDSNPRMMRFSPDGRFAYLLMEMSNEVDVYTYQDTPAGPEFERIQTVRLLEGYSGNAASSMLEFAPGGGYIYVSVDAMNAVICLEVDKETGLLAMRSNTRISGDYPKTLAVLPNDEYFIVINHDSNELRTFKIFHEGHYCLMKNAPVKVNRPNCIHLHQLV